MAFRGSRHVPEAEVWPVLQRLGMASGADANAFTSATRTSYQFNFPHNDDETIATGLARLRDIASELTLAQDAMDAERGVVLAEERLRDTPAAHAFRAMLRLYFPGDIVTARSPIGSTDVLKSAPVSRLRDYYAAFYRPERATLIVVGEIDPAAMRARIETLFADWTPAGPAGTDPVRPAPGPRAAQAELFVEPGAPSILSLAWVVPSRPMSRARMRDDMAWQLALGVLEFRLSGVSAGGTRAFAQLRRQGRREYPGAVVWSAEGSLRPQDWRGALDGAILVLRRMATDGVTAEELDLVKSATRRQLEAAVAGAATRPTRTLAAAIAVAVTTDEVFVAPIDALAIAEEAFAQLTPERIKAAIGAMMRDGPLVFLTSPTPIEGGEAALAAALAADERAPLPPVKAPAMSPAVRVAWPYADFGPAGTVVERATVADLDTTFIRFANGVRLTVRPTGFRGGEVVVNVRIGNGRLDLPVDRATAAWAIDEGALGYGGTVALALGNLQRLLVDKVYGTGAALTDTGLMLRGHTRPADLLAQLQVFAAFTSAPGWRSGALQRAISLETIKARQSAASPAPLFARAMPCLLHGSDPRWCRPSLADLDRIGPDALKQVIAPMLASAPIEVVVIGDVTVDAALDAVVRTFGALPKRAPPASDLVKGTQVRFPPAGAAPVALHHAGRADQGVAVAAWPTTDLFDRRTAAALRVLQAILRTRLFEELRARDGVTYSPSVITTLSTVAPGFGYLVVGVEVPPARMPLFFATMRSITADLCAHAPSADEFARARAPAIESMLARLQTNDAWAVILAGAQEDRRRLDVVRGLVPDLEALTPDAVREAASRFLTDDKMWTAEITPQAGAAAPP